MFSFIYKRKKVNVTKAALIPFRGSRAHLEMMFMLPADPFYGSHYFNIAKGHIDGDESSLEAALREGREELGIILSGSEQIAKVGCFHVHGFQSAYHMDVYTCQVDATTTFATPHFESSDAAWLSYRWFKRHGRTSQLDVVGATHKYIMSNLLKEI